MTNETFITQRPGLRAFIALVLLALVAGCDVLDPDPVNRAPVIEELTASPRTVSPDSASSVAVQANDPEGVALDYRWRATAGWYESGSYAADAVWRAPSTTGRCTLTVTVDDGRDEVSASVSVNVVSYANEPHLVITADERQFGTAGERLPVRLDNDGNADADWTAVFGDAWAAPEPAAGTLAPAAVDTLWLVADRSVPSPGLHVADLTVQAADDAHVLTYGLIQPWTYEVLARYPHDTGAFTQGLVWHEGWLYEGTGLEHGRSSLRQVDLETGQVMFQVALHDTCFGEGITVWQDRIVQLTWRNHRAFVWSLGDFDPLGTFSYTTEGWGLTDDGARLIMSDGTSSLYFRDPDTFALTGSVTVSAWGTVLTRLNELEWIDGGVWSNIWYSDYVVRIDPDNGEVTDVVDLSGLLTPAEALPANVLNGIAHDPATGRTWVTGKLWPWVFEIAIVDPSSDGQRFFFAR
ncbi:glutaminyl-peptide cyclotransferase [bacterium]|nr:glutaminyl-peptide cyclotransferase [bacterium]